MNRSPARKLLVLSANVRKALPRDLIDQEMVNFARRVPEVVPFAPDAVLLQEVVRSSAARVAELLKDTTGFGFDVAVRPGLEPVVGTQGRQTVVRTTAVLLNRRTMRLAGSGGFVDTRYLVKDAAPGVEPRIKEHAHCLARTASGRIELVLASIHFVTNEKFAASTMGFCYKGKWAGQVARFLRDRYPLDDVPQVCVIAGDFNNRRCLMPRERVKCEVWPFWHVLTEQKGLADAVFQRHGGSNESLAAQTRNGKRIDYIFAQGTTFRASHDVDYEAQPGDPDYYSDHRLLWALVGPST
jgi:endonuclease/exonuclease/phosphatase family metal-dependent hydrolase